MRIVWLPSAGKARAEQIFFIANDKPSAALRQDSIIEQRVQMLANFPELGTYVAKANAFRLVIGRTRFIAYYRIVGDRIEIFRFVHGKRKLS